MRQSSGRSMSSKRARLAAAASVLLASLLVGASAAAQVSVTATAGTPGPTTYATVKDAFDAVNLGTHQGAITVSLTGDTTETAPAVLNASGSGSALYTTLLLVPSGGALRTVSGAVAGPLVDLNGADGVTIDGLGTGGNALTISNTSATAGASTIRLVNDATGNTVTNATILGSSTSLTSGTVLFSTGTTTGNDGNTVSLCNVGPAGVNLATNGIVSIGTVGAENSGNAIQACNVSDSFSASTVSVGILVGAGNTGWTVSANRVYQTATRIYTTANTHRGIQLLSGNGHTVSANVVGYASPAASGVTAMTSTVATRFIGIEIGAATGAPTSVQGNTVAAITLATSSGAATANGVLCGISITGGDVYVGTVTPNTIGATTGTGSLAATPTTTQGAVVGINTSSTGTVVLQNNLIGALQSSGSTASIAGAVSGINVSGIATSLTISGNTIGNATALNMRGGTSGLTTGNSIVSGINLASTSTSTTITGNTIRNLVSYGTGTSGYVRGIWTPGATGSTASLSITSNTITNLTCDSANASISSGGAGAAGIVVATGLNAVVSDNTISAIARTNTGTSGAFAVGIALANATSTTVSRNRIWDLSNASTATSTTLPGTVAGILIRSGTTDATVVNNMVSLGTGQTTNTVFIGIQANNGSTPDPASRIYFNTIHIAGTVASGAHPSFGFLRSDLSSTTARTQTVDFRNNVVTNTRSGGTGAHVAIGNDYGATTVSSTGWTSDYNVLNSGSGAVGWWGGSLGFAGWQAASAGDLHSYSGVGVTYVDATSDLHLNMGTTATVMESGGTAIAGITTDFDGQTRPGPAGSVNGGAILPDLGADEFDGVPLDVLPPIVSFTPLPNTALATNRTITASITDVSGVPTAGPNQPRVYFRKNAGSYSSTQCSLASGTGTNGTWICTVDHAALGGVGVGDVIDTFVVAEDLAPTPNLGSSPTGAAGTGVNAVTTPPPTLATYTIVAPFASTVNVGSAESITSITNPGGLFAALNAGVLTGNVTVFVTSSLSGETGAVALNQLVEEGGSGYTLTIRPSGGAFTVDGDSTTASPRALIRLNGADRVTIDGSVSGGTDRSLTFTNADTSTASAVILVSSGVAGAQGNTLENLVVAGSGSLATFLGIGFGGATVASLGADNDGNRVQNCDVRSVQFGIASQGASIANKNTGTVITGNVLNNTGTLALGKGAIIASFEDGLQVTGNAIGGIVSTSSNDVFGISLGGLIAWTNTLAAGGSEVSNATVTGNVLGTIQQTNTFSAAGIVVTPATTGTNLIANNFVSGVLSNGTAGDFGAGIFVADTGTDSLTRIWDNSVSMSGTATGGSQGGYALAVNGADPSLDVRGNVLSNTQTTGTGLSYAVGLGSATFANLTSDFNDLFTTTGGTFAVGRIGNITPTGGTDEATLAAWQGATAKDAASLSVDPLFRSATDLHLQGTSTLLGLGTSLSGVTADIDGDPRPAGSPDIGADEVVQAVAGSIPAGTFYNVLGAGGDTLGGNVTVTNELTLTGAAGTGASTLTIGCNAVVTGAGATSYVVGNLKKSYCATGAKTFEVGTANGYSPVDASVTAGTFPADLTVTAVHGPQPFAYPASAVLQRYWTLAGAGLTADLTFHYLDADVPVTATEANFVIYKFNGAVYATPGGTVTPASNTANITGVSSFSDWTLAEPGTTPVELMEFSIQ